MGRYRAPRPRSSAYITPEGERTLREELRYLWKEKRPAVTQAVREAAAQGDRSENAEYIYGKKQLREIDSRVRYLSKRLDEVTVVRDPPQDMSRVFFGALVTLEDADSGEQVQYRLVGPDEFDINAGCLSVDAPLARAMLKKTVVDEVTLETAEGVRTWFLVSIEYP